jgi:hypothetical protein
VQDLQRIARAKPGISRAFGIAVAAVIAAASAAGCGGEPTKKVPAGCLEGPSALRAALLAAPGEVRVGGSRPSDCFPRASSQGDVENMGAIFIDAAERLADESKSRPRDPALLRLGFLVGAAHRGAGKAQGIYSELLRRLDAVLTRVPTSAPAFRRGRAAGADHG